MKVAIYSPYLDTAGGGEKYILTIAEVLKTVGDVDVLLDNHLFRIGADSLKKINEDRHGLILEGVKFIRAPIGSGSSFIKKSLFLMDYDWLFYNTDGSWFFSTAKNNIIHFQIPFISLPKLTLWQKIKLLTWKQAIYNSRFTQEFVQKQLPLKGHVIYPPVDIDRIKPLSKKKQILSVGRFAVHTRSKKHEILIEAFQDLSKNKSIQDWSLHLAGGVLEGDQNYLAELKNLAKGYKIFFHPNISLESLNKLYGGSSIYWHAAGFAETSPEKFEHFGISTVEAMAAGCVPVVINLGGQREIVEDGINGLLWSDLDQLRQKTLRLIRDLDFWKKLSKSAIRKSEDFSASKFKEELLKLIYEN